MVVRMRHTRAKTRRRRSHHKVSEPRFSRCANCGAEHVRHRACVTCGTYRGKEAVDVTKKAKKQERKRKEREKENAS